MLEIDYLPEPKKRIMMNVVHSVQFRFPRSKKRRIRRKWAKQGQNYRHVPAVISISPETYQNIKDHLGYEPNNVSPSFSTLA